MVRGINYKCMNISMQKNIKIYIMKYFDAAKAQIGYRNSLYASICIHTALLFSTENE